MLQVGLGLCSLPVLAGGVGADDVEPIVIDQTAGVATVARAFDPIPVEQTAGVQIVARAFDPIPIEQTATVAIIAEEGGGFDPENLSDPLIWLDLADATSYTESGGVITSWTNKFTSQAYAEATNRPVYNATHMAGGPAAVADGINDKLPCTTDTVVEAGLADALDYYLIALVQGDDTDAVEVFFSVGNSGGAGPGSKRWGTSTTGTPGKWAVVGTPDTGSGLTAESTVSVTTAPTIFEARCVSGVTSLRISTAAAGQGAWTAGTPTAYGTLTPDQSGVFHRASSTPATFWDGAMSELLAYGPAVANDTAAQDALLDYVNTKWGIF